MNLGVTVTSLILLTLIVGTVIYLSVRKPDVIPLPTDPVELAALDEPETAPHHRPESRRSALIQTVVTLVLVVVVGTWFYVWRTNMLNAEAAVPVTVAAASSTAGTTTATGTSTGAANAGKASPLGDMTPFIVISQDTLAMLDAGKQAPATTRITDLESAWDNAQATLKRRNADEWHAVDDRIDVVLRELRSTSPNPASEKTALQALLSQMGA
jgi:hypothetical protein